MRVLIVEDERKIANLLKTHFEIRRHEVSLVPSGEEALDLLSRQQPDVTLLDVRLEGRLDGRAVLPEAKRLHPAMPVVIMTGLVDAEPSEYLQLGASGFLKKPIELPELDHMIAQFVNSAPSLEP
jgi:DNA-binding NtrC family response regulator